MPVASHFPVVAHQPIQERDLCFIDDLALILLRAADDQF
jgi:hypothetical protein